MAAINPEVLKRIKDISSKQDADIFFDLLAALIKDLRIGPDDPRLALTVRNEKSRRRISVNLNGRLVFAIHTQDNGDWLWFAVYEEDYLSLVKNMRGLASDGEKFKAEYPQALVCDLTVQDFINQPTDALIAAWLRHNNAYIAAQKASQYRIHHIPALYEMAVNQGYREEVYETALNDTGNSTSRTFKEWTDRYIAMIRADANAPERYKWTCLQHFQNTWDTEAEDFGAMLKAALSRQENLVYQNSLAFIIKAAQSFPEEVRDMFRGLFKQENLRVRALIEQFQDQAAKLAERLNTLTGKSWSHQQDERTISFYLAMHVPDAFPLYKLNVYERLLSLFPGVSKAAVNERYGHFIKLGLELLPLVQEDEALHREVAATLQPGDWRGPQDWLIFQDILYRNMVDDNLPEVNHPKPVPKDMPQAQMPLNTILYGPPGTGKTYTTLERAVQCAEPTFQPEGENIQEQRAGYRSKYEQLKEEGRIRFITFHQSFSYEDFIEGIKPAAPAGNDAFLKYVVRDGVFKRLCVAAKTSNQQGVQAPSGASTQNFVLIIDEINRGNVSQIFGELITLIEEDKRAGREEALEVTLPYSGETFSVPPNLYLIGTMNTADRSVEALDTALRRRFSFVEMAPDEDHELVERAVTIDGRSFDFSRILKTINARMEVLAGRDHKIGHSYFLNQKQDWKAYLCIFTQKIIPLLQEYFYGDYSPICLVLGSGFVQLQQPATSRSNLFAALPTNSRASDQLDALHEKEVWRLTDWSTTLQTNPESIAPSLGGGRGEALFAAALETLLNTKQNA